MEINKELSARFNNSRKELIFATIFMVTFFVILIIAAYHRDNGVRLLIEVIFMLSLLMIFIYVNVIKVWRVMTNTVVSIVENGDNLVLATSGLSLLGKNASSPKHFDFSIGSLNLESTYYPLERKFNYNGKVSKFDHEKNTYYILIDYFDEQLTPILTKYSITQTC